MFESMGLPLPAESLIIGASLYAGSTHHLEIRWIALAAVLGAIMGDNIGYLLGHHFGYSILQKHGKKVGLTEERLMLGRYLFRKHGGIVVFFGRFIAVLRVFVAILAGANRMPWHSFLIFNAMGGICWAGGYAFVTYELGQQIEKISGPVGIIMAVLGVCCLLGAFLFLKKNEKRLTEEAMKHAEAEEKKDNSRQKKPA
ncbi:DedA family protein [Gluconobacter morbifer]|nr:DedA family protein [Gluconobacter morbifer]